MIDPEWSKSKEELWDEYFEPLIERSPLATHKRRIPLWGYAASLLIPVLLVVHFYAITEVTPRGEHAVIRLPDHSTVTMNAESRVSYKPFEWFLFRRVRLEGEAFFDVKPGSRFSVLSGRCKVDVQGTTFNVYARPGLYHVTCLSGQVEVQAEGESVVLNEKMQATLRETKSQSQMQTALQDSKSQSHKLQVNNDVETHIVTGWMQGKFVFIETPLREVVAEIERQYNINVIPADFTNHLFTGNFSKMDKPEVVVEIIGKPFGITFRYAK